MAWRASASTSPSTSSRSKGAPAGGLTFERMPWDSRWMRSSSPRPCGTWMTFWPPTGNTFSSSTLSSCMGSLLRAPVGRTMQTPCPSWERLLAHRQGSPRRVAQARLLRHGHERLPDPNHDRPGQVHPAAIADALEPCQLILEQQVEVEVGLVGDRQLIV